jgi:ribose transport system permease protein
MSTASHRIELHVANASTDTRRGSDLATHDGDGAPRKARRQWWALISPRNVVLLGLIATAFTYVALRQPRFGSTDNLRVLAIQIAVLGIPALGMTFLMIAGYVDLSIGSMFSLIAVLSTHVAGGLGLGIAVLVALVTGLLLGSLNGALVLRLTISPLIVTLAGLTLYQGIVNVATKGQGVNDFDSSFGRLGQGTWIFGVPNGVSLFIALAVIGAFVIGRTNWGLNIFAIGGNPEAAKLVGLPVRSITLTLFAVNGAIVALAAVLTASRFGGATPLVGVGLELNVITAVILGGVSFTGGEGSVLGTILAVILLTVVTSGIVALNIDSYFSNVVSGALLLGAVAVDQFTEEQRDRYRRLLAIRTAMADDDQAR